MGCTPSSEVSPAVKSEHNSTSNGQVTQKQGQVTEKETVANNNKNTSHLNKKSQVVKKEHNNNEPIKNDQKSIAFEIEFESKKNYGSLLSKHPPKRLQHLAPLPDSAPKLTQEQLEEKIHIAEQNRINELEKKKELPRRSSRLRQEVMRAREVEKIQDDHQQQEMEVKQRSADLFRQKKQQEIAEKKQKREERAKRAKQRAAQMKDGEELDYEIEKDDDFNQEDNDSWLDGDNNTSDYHTDNDRFNSGQANNPNQDRLNSGDHVYNGRSSPSKSPRKDGRREVSTFSTSTTDSHNNAFQRTTNNTERYDRDQADDDFFDS